MYDLACLFLDSTSAALQCVGHVRCCHLDMALPLLASTCLRCSVAMLIDSSIECFGSNQRSQSGYPGGANSDMNSISNSISSISTPNLVEEIIENQPINFSFLGRSKHC